MTIEQRLAAIWRETVGSAPAHPDLAFQELATDDSAATRLAAKIATTFDCSFDKATLQARPTLKEQARYLRSRLLARKARRTGIPPREDRTSPVPLSFAQQRLWILDQLDPGSTAYNMSQAFDLRGPLDVDALRRAIEKHIRRHESLRTRFELVDEQPVQLVSDSTQGHFILQPIEPVAGEDSDTTLHQHLRQAAALPFDLRNGPVFRAFLFVVSPEWHVLLLSQHHIVSDGWSRSLQVKEIGALYEAEVSGATPQLPEPPIQYPDYSIWQREQIESGAINRQLEFWRRELGRGVPKLQLPTDRPRRTTGIPPAANERFQLSHKLSAQLREFAQRERCTLFMVMMTIYQVLLHRLSGQNDFAVGTVVAGRIRPELEKIVGFFVNTLVFRAELEGDPTFRALLDSVKTRALEVFDAQDVPFAKLVEDLNPPRESGETPFFQVSFAYQNMPGSALPLKGIDVTEIPLGGSSAKFDISLAIHDHDRNESLAGVFEYNADLFDAETMAQFARCFQRLCESVATSADRPISELAILHEQDRERLLSIDPPVDVTAPARFLHKPFEKQARLTPDAVALCFRDETLTYGELDRLANAFAACLQRHHVSANTVIGVRMHRCTELFVAILGILKAGGAYLPLDPDLPADRLDYMLKEAGARIVVTHAAAHADHVIHDGVVVDIDDFLAGLDNKSSQPAAVDLAPEDLAYVIFTSGSTGHPKGVAIHHGAAGNLMRWTEETFAFHPSDSFLLKTPIGFDASVPEIFAPLQCGARLVIAEPGAHKDPEYIARIIEQHGITILQMVPSMLRMLLEHSGFGRRAASLRTVFAGGEALSGDLRDLVFRTLPQVELINLYGPTEAAVNTLFWRSQPGEKDKVVPIGHPVANIRAYVVDKHLQPVPLGVAGELVLSGASVGRGYINRPDLTEDRFFPDPFANSPGVMAYRTGDLVRRRRNGVVDFLGRLDHQVKIRGFRIELGEIEAVARSFPGVNEAVVTPRQDHAGEPRLVAYLESQPATIDEPAFLRHLGRQLPEYMIPASVVVMERLPLLTNGKVDRRALPDPPDCRGKTSGDLQCPRTPTEQALAKIWQDLLGIEQVGVHDNFFQLGGHSLTAMRAVARATDVLGVPVRMALMFSHPTIAELAAQLDADKNSDVQESSTGKLATDRLSHQEARLWYLHQTLERPESYNVPWTSLLAGPLDLERLQRALDILAQRHEALRTCFVTHEGEPRRKVHEHTRISIRLEPGDNGEFPSDEALRQRLQDIVATPFDLENAPLIHVHVLRRSNDRHVLAVVAHHIIVDQWSMQILIRELGILYRSDASPDALPPIPETTLSDYVAAQAEADYTGTLAFWRRHLEGAPATVNLPIDRTRPGRASGKGIKTQFALPAATVARLNDLARQHKTTRFALGMTAFAAFLYRISGDNDLVIGTPVADRARPELQTLVGFMLNTLPVRMRIDGAASFAALLANTGPLINRCLGHADAPLDEIVRTINTSGSGRREAPFSVMFVHQDEPENEINLGGIPCERVRLFSDTAKAELSLFLSPTSDGRLEGMIEASRDIFDPETVENLARWFTTFADALATGPASPIDRHPIESRADTLQLIKSFNPGATAYPRDATVSALFSAQAAREPDRTALVHRGQKISYGQLEAWSNQLANHLTASGVEPGSNVATLLDRSPDYVATVLAVLKCGAAYVPLAADLPEERLRYILQNARVSLVVTDSSLPAGERSMDAPVLDLRRSRDEIASRENSFTPRERSAEDVAYIMFTSGSTGQPKGVMIPHRGIVRLVKNQKGLPITPDSRFLLLAPLSFDASTFELWGPLLNGGCCAIFEHPFPEPDLLAEAVRTHGIDILWLTVGLFNNIVDLAPQTLAGVRHILTGGDALSIPHIRRALAALPEAQLYNAYGPTESTTFATIGTIDRDEDFRTGTVPIGRPISNTTCHVLDKAMAPVPAGIAGELFIGGDGLATGYLHDDTLTAARFVADPFSEKPGGRLYRTGDRCRWLRDGRLEFLGRLDNQVKIRGFRIEPGEIESALGKHPDVSRAAVVVSKTDSGDKQLVAFVVPREGVTPSPQDLAAGLRSRLPDYMIPTVIRIESALPLNANGKIDRRELARRRIATATTTLGPVAPRNEVETRLTAIWARLLERSDIGVDDNFFELGGHSLLAMKLIHEVHREFAHTLRIADLLECPTIASLAPRLGAACSSVSSRARSRFSGSGSGTPLFNIPGVMGYGLIPEALAEAIDGRRPYYDGLQIPGADKQAEPLTTLSEIAANLVKQIRAVQPHGPYSLTGFCFGGLLAYETAHQLVEAGEEVQALVLWHAFPMHLWETRTLRRRLADIPRGMLQGKLPYYLRRFFQSLRFHLGVIFPPVHPKPETLDWARDNPAMVEANREAQRNYRAPETTIPTFVIRGNDINGRYIVPPKGGWEYLCKGPFEIIDLPIDHLTMLEEPWISQTCKLTARWLRQTDPRA